jgi:hypothetical protein
MHSEAMERIRKLYFDRSYKSEEVLSAYRITEYMFTEPLKVNLHATTLAIKTIQKLISVAINYGQSMGNESW